MAAINRIACNIFILFPVIWTLFPTCFGITEYCNGDVFEATCATNEVIVVDRAVYGRMNIGRCVRTDRGYLGCHNDALQALDRSCSGKQSCQLTISNKLWKDGSETCEDHLVGYAELDYSCHEVLGIQPSHCHGEDINIGSDIAKITSSTIYKICGSFKRLNVAVQAGQHLNITLLNFTPEAHQSLGTIRDRTSNNLAELSGQMRSQHIMTSVANRVEIEFQPFHQDKRNFIIEFQLLGCRDMSPPDGAWVTRDGDVIEIGCYAGSKTWSLKCENSQWIGVVGYCGTEEKEIKSSKSGKRSNSKLTNRSISLNALLFGACSVVILISACIFLAGVIVLKRKLSTTKTSGEFGHHSLPLLTRQGAHFESGCQEVAKAQHFSINTMTMDGCVRSNEDYKSL